MTEKQLFYPLLSVYFSLILGDLQKEKLQIVSIFRFGHKKRGLFQCPRMGGAGNIREHALEIFTDTHGSIGNSPEKPQIFLYLFVVAYSRIKENTLQVTPTAKRNSYRVAILVGRLPRVASFARNPGLGNATPSELQGVRTVYNGITIHGCRGAHHRQQTNYV